MNRIYKYCFAGLILFNGCSTEQSEEVGQKAGAEQTETTKEEMVIYERNGNCDAFIADLDFTTFCFSNGSAPEYRLVQDSENNCQYQLHDDRGYHNIDFSIAFANFNKVMGEEPQPELAKAIFLKAYDKKRNERMRHPDAKVIEGLGDDAYIGYNQKKSEQYLGLRMGNVVFTCVYHHGSSSSQQSCMSSEDDLKRMGQLIVERILR